MVYYFHEKKYLDRKFGFLNELIQEKKCWEQSIEYELCLLCIFFSGEGKRRRDKVKKALCITTEKRSEKKIRDQKNKTIIQKIPSAMESSLHRLKPGKLRQ